MVPMETGVSGFPWRYPPCYVGARGAWVRSPDLQVLPGCASRSGPTCIGLGCIRSEFVSKGALSCPGGMCDRMGAKFVVIVIHSCSFVSIKFDRSAWTDPRLSSWRLLPWRPWTEKRGGARQLSYGIWDSRLDWPWSPYPLLIPPGSGFGPDSCYAGTLQ